VSAAKYRVEADPKMCTWCRRCELVCSLRQEEAFNPALSRIRVLIDEFAADAAIDVCRQCETADCVIACPVEGAMAVDEATGARIIVESECIGCGACASACPYNSENTVIAFNQLENVYVKCDLCGGRPRCVEICPSAALKYVEVRGC